MTTLLVRRWTFLLSSVLFHTYHMYGFLQSFPWIPYVFKDLFYKAIHRLNKNMNKDIKTSHINLFRNIHLVWAFFSLFFNLTFLFGFKLKTFRDFPNPKRFNGLWTMSRSRVSGPGSWIIGHCSMIKGHWSGVIDHGLMIMGYWSWVVDHGLLIMGYWSWVLYEGSLIMSHWYLAIEHGLHYGY